MLGHLEDSIESVREAQASIIPTNKIKTSEAYILGSLKASLASLQVCKDIVKSAIESQAKLKAEVKPEPQNVHE